MFLKKRGILYFLGDFFKNRNGNILHLCERREEGGGTKKKKKKSKVQREGGAQNEKAESSEHA